VRYRFITVILGLIFFAASLAGASFLPTGFLPVTDTARSMLGIELPPGSQLSDSEAVTDTIVNRVRKRPDVASVFVDGGRLPSGAVGVGTASITISYVPKSKRTLSQQQLEQAIGRDLADIPDTRYWFVDDTGQRNVKFIVTGQDNATVANVASDLTAQMRQLPVVANVVSGATLNRPELRIYPRRDLAVRLGVSTESLSETIRVATIGDVAPALAKFDTDGRTIPIRVLLEENARADRQVLEQIRIPSQRGGDVPLVALADISFGEGATNIIRYDRQRQASVEADLAGGAALSEAREAIKAVSVMNHLPAGITVSEGGDAELQTELFDGFGGAMRSGLMMVYVVLAVLFTSLLQPVTILFSLPLSIAGAILALLITNLPITTPVVIGILMLMGIVTKNAIMLVDFAVEAMHGGVDRSTAIIDAGRKRARPIIMTTIAMVAGMAPSALAFGSGGEFRSPMAIAIIGGLLVSTLLSLLFVPAFFVIMADVGRIFSRLIGRVTEEAESPPLARFTPLRMDHAPQQSGKARIDSPGE
jgi:multidrug efflux pump subunit AcrB